MDHLPSWLLNQTSAYAQRLIGEGFAEAGARGYHYRLLRSLALDGPASQADLGRRTGIHLSDMVAALNELQQGGYIARSPDKTDKRRNVISLTSAGRAREKELAKRAEDIQEALLEPLNEGEREQLTALLRKLYQHHRQGLPPLPRV